MPAWPPPTTRMSYFSAFIVSRGTHFQKGENHQIKPEPERFTWNTTPDASTSSIHLRTTIQSSWLQPQYRRR